VGRRDVWAGKGWSGGEEEEEEEEVLIGTCVDCAKGCGVV
jgi:hypothetical protein